MKKIKHQTLGNLIKVGITFLGIALGVCYVSYEENLRSELEQLASTNQDRTLSPQEKIIMYNACGSSDTTGYLNANQLKKGIRYFKSQ